MLIEHNPSTDPQDHAALLKSGCTINGFQCLKVKEIVQSEQAAPDTFRFVVAFRRAAGDLFVLGPCCEANATDMPPRTQFDFTVKKIDGRFLVQELPVYVP